MTASRQILRELIPALSGLAALQGRPVRPIGSTNPDITVRAIET
jgi:hypothetical protein